MTIPTYLTDAEQHETSPSTGAYTITLPSWAAGNLMVLLCGAVRNGTGGTTITVSTPPSGYTLIDSVIQSGDASNRSVSLYAYYRVMVSGDTNPSITWSGSAIRAVNAVCLTSFSAASPMVAAVAKTSGLASGATQQSWTPAVNALGLEMGINWGSNSYSAPSGWTSLQKAQSLNMSYGTDRSTAGNPAGTAVGSASVAVTGATYCVMRVGVQTSPGLPFDPTINRNVLLRR